MKYHKCCGAGGFHDAHSVEFRDCFHVGRTVWNGYSRHRRFDLRQNPKRKTQWMWKIRYAKDYEWWAGGEA
jgi:hypothetical protein